MAGHPGLAQMRFALGIEADCLVRYVVLPVVGLSKGVEAVAAQVEGAEVGEEYPRFGPG